MRYAFGMGKNDPPIEPLTVQRAEDVLERLAPGFRLESHTEMRGSFSNSTWLVTGRGAGDAVARFVVRRLRGGWSDPSKRASLEFHALRLAASHGIPAPEPLLLDADGTLLGVPGFIAAFVKGIQTVRPQDRDWVRELAHTLARVHEVQCVDDDVLLNANEEALYFTRSADMPEAMRNDPDGSQVWDAILAHRTKLISVQPTLVHLDFWTGNLLWRDGRIVGVVDWEEASCGDPAIDVAYLRRDLWGLGMRAEAEWLLEEYESVVGRQVANLAFWELAAAVRSMPDPAGGVEELRALGVNDRTADDLATAHREFIASAIARV